MTHEKESPIAKRRRLIEKENNLRAAYRRVFGEGGVDTKLIMEDLEALCFFTQPAFEANEANQPYLTIHRDGLRAVLLHIKTMATAKPLNEEDLLKELQDDENE